MMADNLHVIANILNIAFRGGAIMFIGQRFGLDWAGLSRSSINVIVQLGILVAIIIISFLGWTLPGFFIPNLVGPQVGVLMAGYQFFNFYEDVTAIQSQLAQRRSRYQNNPSRRDAAIKRYIHRTLIMLFHHAVAFYFILPGHVRWNQFGPSICFGG